MKKDIKDLYAKDTYLTKNPTLHEEDSPWKVSRIKPLLDRFAEKSGTKKINLLDVGGGAGRILTAASLHLKDCWGIEVNKYALDLSPAALTMQHKNNPDLKKALNEDVCRTSLKDKEIDLTLMIDILEHIPDPGQALREAKRISKFAILKVPLENNLHVRLLNFLKRGKIRRRNIETFGHINIYGFRKLKEQIETNMGCIRAFHFTNIFEYYLTSEHYAKKMNSTNKLLYTIAASTFKISPRLSSLLFSDFVVALIECY